MATFTLPKFTFTGSVIFAFTANNSFTSPLGAHNIAIIKDRKKEVVSIFRHNLFLLNLIFYQRSITFVTLRALRG
jgi:hypothetical protein